MRVIRTRRVRRVWRVRGAYVCEAGQEHTVRIRAQRWRVEGCRGLGRGLEGVHTHVPCVCHNPLPRDESRGEWAVLGPAAPRPEQRGPPAFPQNDATSACLCIVCRLPVYSSRGLAWIEPYHSSTRVAEHGEWGCAVQRLHLVETPRTCLVAGSRLFHWYL